MEACINKFGFLHIQDYHAVRAALQPGVTKAYHQPIPFVEKTTHSEVEGLFSVKYGFFDIFQAE